MNHNQKSAGDLTEKFSSRDTPEKSVITLGGTGPNGSCQIAVLELLGLKRVQALKSINIISGSAFGFFIYLAFHEGKMKIQNYLDYDKGVRVIHGASFFRATKYYFSGTRKKRSLYDCERVKQTVFHLFSQEYANRELQSFNPNLVFWAYCSLRQEVIRITSETFPNMKVWEVISASLSIRSIHGEFDYEPYRFSDPMFCSDFRKLIKALLKGGENHLFINYKKTQISRNVIFLKNQDLRLPTLGLIYDFVSFVCNFRNRRLTRTHKENASMLADRLKLDAPLEH